ncbi:hypothetical protein [Streptomyces sp. NPDC048603]|uniref:SCO4983 family protein n=1 Tax=Streptomyces sp. NPDC048603 TaxID=3365577 RepID=UPI0037226683
MYEPNRTKPAVAVRMGRGHTEFPHRSRAEELDIQLAGHLTTLLAATDELGLGEAAERIATQVARLRGTPPARHAALTGEDRGTLHRRAHELAARVLLVAASRADTAVAILAAEQMDAHTAALAEHDLAGAR